MSRKHELRVTDYLQHIFDAIERIESYLAGGDEQAFIKSLMVQDAVIRNLEIIGEAAAPSTLRPQPSIPNGITSARCAIG
jgi:uncharacterized protein with HEPN domain